MKTLKTITTLIIAIIFNLPILAQAAELQLLSNRLTEQGQEYYSYVVDRVSKDYKAHYSKVVASTTQTPELITSGLACYLDGNTNRINNCKLTLAEPIDAGNLVPHEAITCNLKINASTKQFFQHFTEENYFEISLPGNFPSLLEQVVDCLKH